MKVIKVILIIVTLGLMSCASTSSKEVVSKTVKQNVTWYVGQIDKNVKVVDVLAVLQDPMNTDYAFIEAIVPGEMTSKFFIVTKSDEYFAEARSVTMASKNGWRLKSSMMGGLSFTSETYCMYQIVCK